MSTAWLLLFMMAPVSGLATPLYSAIAADATIEQDAARRSAGFGPAPLNTVLKARQSGLEMGYVGPKADNGPIVDTADRTDVVRIADRDFTKPPPDLSQFKTFEAIPPYRVTTQAGPQRVKLRIFGSKVDVPRKFDFVAPIINPQTGHTDALSLQTPVQTSIGLKFVNLTDTSTPPAADKIPGDRIELTNGKLLVGYHANDPCSDKCRVQINSWPIPLQRELVWDLSFRLGGENKHEQWPINKPNSSPTLLWQVKAEPAFPSIGFFVVTSAENPENIQLTFFQRLENERNNSHIWVLPDLRRDEFIDVIVKASLDDRDAQSNSGMLQVWINQKLIIQQTGRNLIQNTKGLHRWIFGVYLLAERKSIPESRITEWRRARMLIAKKS